MDLILLFIKIFGRICNKQKHPEARIDSQKSCIESMLMSIHFLYRYKTETENSALFKICEKSVRNWCWYFVGKIRALKKEKVRQCCPKTTFSLCATNASFCHAAFRLFGLQNGTQMVKMSPSLRTQWMGYIVIAMNQLVLSTPRIQSTIPISSTKQVSTTNLVSQFLKINLSG